MSDLLPIHQIDRSRVRKEWHDGEWYYSVIDVVAALLDVDHKRAKNYYHVFKNRLNLNNEQVPYIKRLKSKSLDHKSYLTDFTNVDGVQLLQKYIEPKKTRREFRYQISKRDEVLNFHPKVTAFLEDKGWNTKHHVKLASGHIIDVVAETEGGIYVIECKPKLSRGNFFTAIGQTLCYSQEYSAQARVAIATYSIEVDDYIQKHCDLLGIEIIEIAS